MSAKTRINRPTTATPSRMPWGSTRSPRYVWVSTPYGHIPRHVRQRRLGIPATGLTYTKREALPR